MSFRACWLTVFWGRMYVIGCFKKGQHGSNSNMLIAYIEKYCMTPDYNSPFSLVSEYYSAGFDNAPSQRTTTMKTNAWRLIIKQLSFHADSLVMSQDNRDNLFSVHWSPFFVQSGDHRKLVQQVGLLDIMNGRAWFLKCKRVNIKSLIGWLINNIASDHSVTFVDRLINGDSYRNLYCIILKIMNSLSQLLLKQKQWREWGTLSKLYMALVSKCQEDLLVVISLISRCKSLSKTSGIWRTAIPIKNQSPPPR